MMMTAMVNVADAHKECDDDDTNVYIHEVMMTTSMMMTIKVIRFMMMVTLL